ncbi:MULTISPECIES: helix-turn-helix domain-containing protein [Streptomyces]|uniref:helix-turn-helix domain-containing protein n=1 Tax=Streptomyces TaxID=1883 RepID=UPI001E45C1A5|nr:MULTISPECIES: helix-turn-helix transcriptional regulator [Streptomyces]UFQ15255.1 helix-turn-helix transcriptional regulator [Streptomyces huasconensis]WCL84860.1 helix-turn-helix transcriptional regulator [Streptomyces sp. JCM 35825]
MARPERSIPACDPDLERLAEWLRRQRRAAGLSHREMAETSGHAFSATTFSRAASGYRIPRLPVVEAYARACGAPVGEARRLWQAARYAEHRRRNPGAGVPEPDRVYDREGLAQELRKLYHKAGAMPVDEMERRAGRHGELPHSTVLRMLAGKSVLGLAQLMAFLRVCEVTDGVEVRRWCAAWERARRRQEVERQANRLARVHEASARSRRSVRDNNASAAPGGGPATHPRFHPYPHAALAGSWKQRTGAS